MTEARGAPPAIWVSQLDPTWGCRNRPPRSLPCFRPVIYREPLNLNVLRRNPAGRRTTRPAVTNLESSFAMVPRIAEGAGARRGDRLGISDCRRTVRGRLADRAQVDARAGANRRRRGDRGHLARDQRRLALSGAAGHLARYLLRGVDRHRRRRNLPRGGVVFRRPLELRALARRRAHHRRRNHAQARALSAQRPSAVTAQQKLRSFPRKRESRGRGPELWVPAFAGTNGRECIEMPPKKPAATQSPARVVGGARMT